MAGLSLGAALTVALLGVLTFQAAAQEGGTYPSGPSSLTDSLEIPAGETLRIGPATVVTGSGNITVWGTLLVNGTAGSPAELSVQVRVMEGGRAEFRQARLWGVNATAIEIAGGEVLLRDSLVEASARGVLVKGSGRLEAADTVFRKHAGEAIYLEGDAVARVDHATFSENGRGATLYSARQLHINDSTFVANGQHLVVDLGPWSASGADILLARDRFDAPAPTPAQLPSIVLRHDAPLVDAGEERLVRLDSNRIAGAPVGMRVEGRALAVESVNDSFLDNGVGLSVQLSRVQLRHTTFGNDRDLEGSGRVSIDDATYLRDRTPSFAPEGASASWLPWAIGAGLVVLLGAALLVPRLARRAPEPPPTPVDRPDPTPLAEPKPTPVEPDLGAAISATERRILEDILDHPGTAQRAVADRLGYTRQALHYHVKKLEARGLVRKTVEGRETRCEVPPAVASLLSSTRTRTQEKA